MSAIVNSPLPDIPLPLLQSFFSYYLPAKPRYPDYAALTDGVTGRRITVARLRNDSLRLGLGIQRLLTLPGPQQTVAVIYSPNTVDFAQIFFGCQAVKVVTSLANASYTASELAHQLRDGEPSIAFVHPSIYDAYLGAIKLLESEGKSSPKLFWAVPRSEVPRELLEGAKSYEVLLVDEAAVLNFEVADAISNPGSVGRLYPCLQAQVVDEDLKPAKVGEPGELCLKGPTVMKGYWRNEEATKASFTPDGWYRSGDIAHIDSKGHIYIVDRLKELIKYKGFQVPPADLEKLLLTHPKVGDVAVIGIHSREFATELPRAYVVPAASMNMMNAKERDELSHELVTWVEENVANHKRLRGGCILIDTIPKSAAGKILRKQLRAMAKAEQDEAYRGTLGAKL
ncbi:hypothetical protein QFC22_000143 [Naganishia vaughanmartiniae]|uniref:Uncharacterized protein n=1 Tax=Naganishia vaughanmartiniae TaxID=1424756 RepID=A0ACC2XP95_9TREE|nr:hypothetical protein QFC22_000143 [Naganishia vaughanmartiniae]